jgi:hypothetical protein
METYTDDEISMWKIAVGSEERPESSGSKRGKRYGNICVCVRDTTVTYPLFVLVFDAMMASFAVVCPRYIYK